MGKIRNVSQTVQERTVIKSCPDAVVYLEGYPYIPNYYLATNPANPVLVNFNDHITSFNANYDVDQTIPFCTFDLTVPAHLRNLYQTPGGNNVIKTMMQVQVYMKGYYFAADGNTVFYRVFKGLVSHVTHTDDGKTLLISVQCVGILRFFELMQLQLSPGIQSSSALPVTPMKTILYNMSPYLQLAFCFLFPSFTEGFQVASLQQSSIQGTPYYAAIEDGFAAKWQVILADISTEAHIYGLQQKEIASVQQFFKTYMKASALAGSQAMSLLAEEQANIGNIKETDQATSIQFTEKIRTFLPENGLGTVQLLNQKVTSRLEFLRAMATLINYECYQDIDGQIIIKPPLFNLDVTNLGSTTSNGQRQFKPSSVDRLTNSNNPFIVHLAEISNESETEDEKAIRATRMCLQGNTSTTQQFAQVQATIRGVAEFIDLPKLAQFGLREEPARTIGWLLDSEPLTVFAQTAAEMTLANRGYRTYSFTIPLRPELHLGFPMFVPHRDMYGYVKHVTINYQIGGNATMNVTLDALRKRPLFPQAETVNNQQTTVFVSQPNLILQWVQGGKTAQTTSAIPTDSPTNLTGAQSSLPSTVPISEDQVALIAQELTQLGSYFATSSDTKDAAWQIQPDKDGTWTTQRQVEGKFFEDIRTKIPYTDAKGYELLSPFPWGRFLDLKTALQEMTRDGYVYQPITNATDYKIVQQTNAFLYAGMATPTSSSDASSSLQQALSAGGASNVGSGATITVMNADGTPLTNTSGQVVTIPSLAQYKLEEIVAFELSYTNPSPGSQGSTITASSITGSGQPDLAIDAALIQTSTQAEQLKVNMFLTGSFPKPSAAFTSAIKAADNMQQSVPQPLTP